MPETPKKALRAASANFDRGRWCFTRWELQNPQGCRGTDFFVAPLPPEYDHLGVLVRRNGDVTLRWADTGRPGVPEEALRYVEPEDILFKMARTNPAQNEDDEEVDSWRGVVFDRKTGQFVRFEDELPPAREVIDEV